MLSPTAYRLLKFRIFENPRWQPLPEVLRLPCPPHSWRWKYFLLQFWTRRENGHKWHRKEIMTGRFRLLERRQAAAFHRRVSDRM